MTKTKSVAEKAPQVKLYAVNAGYRQEDRGRLWYYVRAHNRTEARKRFSYIVSWLDIYAVEEVEQKMASEILSNRYKYITF